MSLIDEKKNISHGCDFLRADLHIHSYGENGSNDVKDIQLTPPLSLGYSLSRTGSPFLFIPEM